MSACAASTFYLVEVRALSPCKHAEGARPASLQHTLDRLFSGHRYVLLAGSHGLARFQGGVQLLSFLCRHKIFLVSSRARGSVPSLENQGRKTLLSQIILVRYRAGQSAGYRPRKTQGTDGLPPALRRNSIPPPTRKKPKRGTTIN